MSDRPSASNIAIGGSGAHARACDRRQASFSRLFRFQVPSPCNFEVALKVGLRCLLRSADPACNTAATCRPCRPAASMRNLQQACRPCSSLMQQACRPLQQAYSCRVCRLSASLQTLQQPAGQQRLRATCRPCRTPPLQTLQQACKTCCLPASPPACMASSLQLLGHFPAFTQSPFPLVNTKP